MGYDWAKYQQNTSSGGSTLPLIAMAGASMIGGMMANKSSAREAAKSRNFQQSMAENAHQMEVKDLAAAGLNPILSGTGGGGASASGGAMATQQDVVSPAVSTALAVNRQEAEIGLIAANTAKANSEKANIEAQTDNLPKTGKLIESQIGLTGRQAELANQQVYTEIERTGLTANQARSVTQDVQESITREYTNLAQRAEIEARTKNISIDNARQELLVELLRKEMPGMLHAAGLSSSVAGDASRVNQMAADAAEVWTRQFKMFGPTGYKNQPEGAYRIEPGPPAGGYPGGSSARSIEKTFNPRGNSTPRGTSNYLGR